MKLSKISAVGILTIVFVIIGMFANFFITEYTYRNNSSGIVLPEQGENNGNVQGGNHLESTEIFNDVPANLTPLNVKSIVETLNRPQVYTAKAINTYFWQDGLGQTISDVYVNNDLSKIVHTEDGSISEHILLTSNFIYSWEHGQIDYYKGNIADFTLDDTLYIPSYKDILNYDTTQITFAEIEYDGSQPNIVVGISPYDNTELVFTVSVQTGLLTSYSKSVDDTVTNTTEIQDISLFVLGDARFMLPDGTTPQN